MYDIHVSYMISTYYVLTRNTFMLYTIILVDPTKYYG